MSHGGWGVTRVKRVNSCHPERKHYARGLCRACYRNTAHFKALRRRYYLANKPQWDAQTARARESFAKLRAKFGLSSADLMAMLDAQRGRCAICGELPKRKRLAFDHCHATGKPRAFLCHPCNNGLGLFRDDPALLKKAIDYLRAHSRHHSLRAARAPKGAAPRA